MFRVLLSVFCLCFCLSVSAQDNRVYLLGKVKLSGTTLTSVVFFYVPEVKTLAMCEKEKVGGHYGRWKHYSHFVRRTAGYAKTVDYSCIETPIVFKKWYDKDFYDFVYLVDIREGKFSIDTAESYSKCMGKLRRVQKRESRFHFCAKGNQDIRSS